MDERIDAFLKDVQELEGVPASAIRDGVRSYLAIYENLVRDTEPDPKSREEAARDWRKLCRRRAREQATTTTTAAGEPLAGLIFVVEDMECRQADIGNFMLAERNFLTHCYVARRRIWSRPGGCGHSARQRRAAWNSGDADGHQLLSKTDAPSEITAQISAALVAVPN